MAILLTANAGNEGPPGDPVDLFGVGFHHGPSFISYIEAEEDETLEGLELVAEGMNRKLLLLSLPEGDSRAVNRMLVYLVRNMLPGIWRLSLGRRGLETSARIITVGSTP